MFSTTQVGDYVVVCSGKPHYAKQRRKVTYIDQNRQTIEAGGDLYSTETGLLRSNGYFSNGLEARRAYLAQGEHLTLALRGEITIKLVNLHVKNLKKVSHDDLFEAARLLGVTLQL